MNKRIFLLVVTVLAATVSAPTLLTAQQPVPAAQAAPAHASPAAAAPQAAPSATPAPALAASVAPVPQAVAPAPAAAAAQKPTPAVAPPPQGTPAPAGQKPAAAAAPTVLYTNVRIDVTITDQAGSGPAVKKAMTLVTSGRNGSVRSGLNVPTVTTTVGAAAAGGVNTIPITSYGFSTRGLNLDVREVNVSSTTGLIHVWLSVEYNPIDESYEKSVSATSPAPFLNFAQSFTLELENGKPLLVAQTSDPVPSRTRTLSVEVKATIVK